VAEAARGNPTDFPRLCQFPEPDLAVSGAIRISPEKISGGDQVGFSVTVTNGGTGDANGIAVRFVVDGATLGADRTIGALAAGASVTVTSETWSAKHRMGLHTVEVRIDPANAIAESNETNNTSAQGFTVQGNKL